MNELEPEEELEAEETQSLKEALAKMECEELEAKLAEHFHSMLLDQAGHDVRHEAGEHRTGVQRQLESTATSAAMRKTFPNPPKSFFRGSGLPGSRRAETGSRM